jgi:hypothetical protein
MNGTAFFTGALKKAQPQPAAQTTKFDCGFFSQSLRELHDEKTAAFIDKADDVRIKRVTFL